MYIDFSRVKINVTVPTQYLEKVRNAICEVGAGVIGNYSDCSISTNCIGTFKPCHGASPFIGKVDNLEFVEEQKLEVVCDVSLVKKVVSRLRDVPIYRTPSLILYYVNLIHLFHLLLHNL